MSPIVDVGESVGKGSRREPDEGAAGQWRVAAPALVPLALLPAVAALAEQVRYADVPRWMGSLATPVAIVGTIGSLLTALLAPIAVLIAMRLTARRFPYRVSLNWFALAAGAFVGLTAMFRVQLGHTDHRREALDRVARRAEPIVSGIERFRAQNGRYPDRLQELIPGELTAIPSTGVATYPEFGYSSSIRGYDLFVRPADTLGLPTLFRFRADLRKWVAARDWE